MLIGMLHVVDFLDLPQVFINQANLGSFPFTPRYIRKLKQCRVIFMFKELSSVQIGGHASSEACILPLSYHKRKEGAYRQINRADMA